MLNYGGDLPPARMAFMGQYLLANLGSPTVIHTRVAAKA